MKYRKILAATLMLLAILTISAISAADDLNFNETQDSIALPLEDDNIFADDIISDGEDDDNYEDDSYLDYSIQVPEEYNIKEHKYDEFISWDFWEHGNGGILDVYVDSEKAYSANIDKKPYASLTADDLGLDLTYKTYTVKVSYHDDDKFEGFNETYDVVVNWGFKALPADEIEESLTYGENLPIYIRLHAAEGDVSYTINGKKYTITKDEIEKNNDELGYSLLIPYTALKIGENELIFTYTGSDYPTDSKEIDIDMYPKIMLNGTSIDFDGKTNAYLTLPSDAKGSLNVYEVTINNEDNTIESYELIGSSPVKDGFASVDISGLDLGNHAIYANYTGSDYTVTMGEFEDEYNYSPYINVHPNVDLASYIYSKDKNYLTITLPSAYEGTLTLNIGGEEKSVSVKNGKGSIEIFNLESAESDWGVFKNLGIDLSFESDDYTYYDWITTKVSDIRPELKMNVTVSDILKGEEYFYYEIYGLPDEISGNLKIFIDGKLFETQLADMHESLNGSSLDFGQHTLKIDYTGNDYFKPTSATTTFDVVDVIIHIDEITDIGTYENYTSSNEFGRIETIYENGYYTLIVDGEIVDMGIVDENINIFAENMTYGPHEVEIIYKNSNVEKSEKSPVKAQYGHYYYQEANYMYASDSITFTFEVPLEVTGNLIVTVDKDYKVPLTNGKAELTVSNLSLGEYEVQVKYDGDKYPELSENMGTFFVNPDENNREVISTNIREYMAYGEEITFTVNAPQDLNAKLYIYDENGNERVELKTVNIINGKASAVINNLGFGEHSINAEISDIENEEYDYFNGIYERVEIMPLLNGTLKMLYEFVNIGNSVSFTVELPDDAKGKLYIYHTIYNETSDEDYEITDGEYQLSNGKATVTLEKFQLAHTFYYIKYDDGKYNVKLNALSLYASPIFTFPQTMTVGSDEYFTITLPSDANGNLNVFNMNTSVKNGVGKISLSGLPIGNYYCAAEYTGDELYGSYSAASYDEIYIITVTKPESDILISKSDDNMIVELNEDATGDVIVKANDKFYQATLKNGKATITGADLNSDDNVTFSYTGNDKYTSISKRSVKLGEKTVQKVAANLTVNARDINEGETATVTFTINKDATGNIAVEIGNANYTAEIRDGAASVTVHNLKAGEHTITAKYEGNDKVSAGTQSVAFKVREAEKDVSEDIIPVKNATSSKTPTYSINLPEDATGTLTVTIANNTYTAEVINGKASVTADNLPAGNYDVTISYSGDDKYSPMVKTTNTTVIVDAKIIAKASTVQYSAGKYYSVTVYGTDGKLANGVAVVFKVNGKTVKTTTTNEKGIASFKVTQIPKTYNVMATALGVSATKKLTVKHVVTLKSATVKKSGKKLVLTATLAKVNGKYLKSKKITFKFNGKKYTAKTSKKGVAKVTIKSSVLKKLKVGKKVTYQATYVKDTVKKTVKVKR